MFRSALQVLLLLLAGCATVPLDYPRDESFALDPDTPTTLKREIDEWCAVNPGPSGFYPLRDGNDALGVRLRLMRIAEKTIDAQYFLMKPDAAGLAFAAELRAAADRGVRVRFLIDDVFTTVSDSLLVLLDQHENIELRLYNPIARQGMYGMNFLGDFKRANRRMHNKSFTIDNQITVVGGRNIADEYFGVKEDGEFLDFDVIGLGPVAAKVSMVFDQFWNDERSIPLAGVVKEYSREDLDKARKSISESTIAKARAAEVRSTSAELVQNLFDGGVPMISAVGTVITDDPQKLANPVGDESFMVVARDLAEAINAAESEVIVLTPYFVPGKDGIEFWRRVTDRGVRVVLVTNSLAANNHTAVHSGYSRYRKAAIEAGIELYEARASATATPGMTLTMHTKAFTIDRRRAFVGSLNVDPRSLEINTEMGLIIESEELATRMAEAIELALPEQAWRVELDPKGKLQWTSTIDGNLVIENSEPEVGGWRKFKAWFLKIAPENQL